MLDQYYVDLVQLLGYFGIFLLVFAESGLLIGLIVPADSILFAAGFLAANGYLDIKLVLIVCFLAAVLGDNVGYFLGAKFGPRIFKKSRIIKKEYLDLTRRYYDRHGAITIFNARFIPFVSTLAPFMAGIAKMKHRTFFFYNVIGGLVWSGLIVSAGYLLPQLSPTLKNNLPMLYIILILVMVLPLVFKTMRRN